jgi:hypothetical protein
MAHITTSHLGVNPMSDHYIMKESQQLTEELMQVMDFTLEELALNRRSQLSNRQRNKLRRLGGTRNILIDLWLGILVVGGGIGAPYVFIYWLPVAGVVLALVLIVSMPILIVKRSRAMLDEIERQRYPIPMIIINVVLGVVLMSAWIGFAYIYVVSSTTPSTSINNLLLVAFGMILLGPIVYLIRRAFHKEVQMLEGPITVEAEGFGPQRDQWSSELGAITNIGLLAAVVARNLLQGRGTGKRAEDFKFVTGYSVCIGKRNFHFVSSAGIGQAFVDGVHYRLYYSYAYPVPLLLSAEAVSLGNLEDSP